MVKDAVNVFLFLFCLAVIFAVCKLGGVVMNMDEIPKCDGPFGHIVGGCRP